MKKITNNYWIGGKLSCKPVRGPLVCLVTCLVILFILFGVIRAQAEWPRVVLSKDGIPISFEVYGSGEPTLVFVHGWSCDARYWRMQIPYFSTGYRVVTLDLAGHGHSGMTRSQYTMRAFGEDVKAVVQAIGTNQAILLGHSMGGSVIAEAARLMPDRIIGLIGVDTLGDIEYQMTKEQLKKMLAPLEKDFQSGAREFVKQMILPYMYPEQREWILSDISAAPPTVALSAMNYLLSQYITGEAAQIFDEIHIPVMCLNSDMWPINYKANRRHMSSFDAIILKGADHFLMMDRSEEFNLSLEKAIQKILKNRDK
ncbi:MAG: alpha/beta hydrolase [Thermodesulfobacteriota bacterium]|nr:alpha/beta hydrolase [Thermodesulfobacteriota bacterium]